MSQTKARPAGDGPGEVEAAAGHIDMPTIPPRAEQRRRAGSSCEHTNNLLDDLGVDPPQASVRAARVVNYGERRPGEVAVSEVHHERLCPATTARLIKAYRRWTR